jgi:hypothetical protein
MAKKKEEKPGFTLPFQKINYILFGIALVVIAIGFYLQSIGPANSVESLTLAPIVLIIGYLVLMPVAIMYKPKED